jgi:hypothetical protein
MERLTFESDESAFQTTGHDGAMKYDRGWAERVESAVEDEGRDTGTVNKVQVIGRERRD